MHSEMAIGPEDYPLLWWLVGLRRVRRRESSQTSPSRKTDKLRVFNSSEYSDFPRLFRLCAGCSLIRKPCQARGTKIRNF
jgi:hypothetical protein